MLQQPIRLVPRQQVCPGANLAKPLTVRQCCACKVEGCSMLKGAWSEADKVQTVQATCMHSAAQ